MNIYEILIEGELEEKDWDWLRTIFPEHTDESLEELLILIATSMVFEKSALKIDERIKTSFQNITNLTLDDKIRLFCAVLKGYKHEIQVLSDSLTELL